MNKQKAQRRHARIRALERAGIELSDAKRAEIIGLIRSGKSTMVQKQSLRVSVHDVTLRDGGGRVRVVYDRKRHELVTFLPPDEPVERIRL